MDSSLNYVFELKWKTENRWVGNMYLNYWQENYKDGLLQFLNSERNHWRFDRLLRQNNDSTGRCWKYISSKDRNSRKNHTYIGKIYLRISVKRFGWSKYGLRDSWHWGIVCCGSVLVISFFNNCDDFTRTDVIISREKKSIFSIVTSCQVKQDFLFKFMMQSL